MRARFVLSQLVSGLRRNVSMTVSVILVTFISLVFVGAAALLQMQIGNMKDDWYDRVEVSVFMCPQDSAVPTCAAGEVTEEQKAAIQAQLEAPEIEPFVQTVYFETKEQAFSSFQEKMSDQWWAAEVTADDMPSSYRIKLADPEKYQVVADVLTGRQGVEEVLDQRRLFDSLFLVLNRATLVSVGIAGVMLLAAVLLITTTIRLSALSRRRETGIMRLVGASNLFIQLPFMLEGAIAATVGAAVAVGALWLGVRYLVTDWLGAQVQWIDYVDSADVLTIAPFLLAIAIVLAAISSVVTLSRYTKV